MNILKEFPSEYLSGVDLVGAKSAVTLVIKAVIKEDARDPKTNTDKAVPVIVFHGTQKKCRLNRSSQGMLIRAWGPESDAWIGKSVSLGLLESNLKDKITGERKLAILVRPGAGTTVVGPRTTQGFQGKTEPTPASSTRGPLSFDGQIPEDEDDHQER